MKSEYSVAPEEELIRLCRQKNWFTCGSCVQYERLFLLNRKQQPLSEIALVIWLCSNDATREEITCELEALHEEYLMVLGEMQQAEGERFADEAYCALFD